VNVSTQQDDSEYGIQLFELIHTKALWMVVQKEEQPNLKVRRPPCLRTIIYIHLMLPYIAITDGHLHAEFK
jgi:hypothetical protein